MSQQFNLSRKGSFKQYVEVVGDPPKTYGDVFTAVNTWQGDVIHPTTFGPPNPELLPLNDNEELPNRETPSPPLISEFLEELREDGANPILEKTNKQRIIYNIVEEDSPPLTLKDDASHTYFDLVRGNSKQIIYEERSKPKEHPDPTSDDIYEAPNSPPYIPQTPRNLIPTPQPTIGQTSTLTIKKPRLSLFNESGKESGAIEKGAIDSPKKHKAIPYERPSGRTSSKTSKKKDADSTPPSNPTHGPPAEPISPKSHRLKIIQQTFAEILQANTDFSYPKFLDLTSDVKTHNDLIKKNGDHAEIHQGLILNQNLAHMREHVGIFLNESDEIYKMYQQAEKGFIAARERNAKLHDDLQLFYEDLEEQARKVIVNLPHIELRKRIPEVYKSSKPPIPTETPPIPKPITPEIHRTRGSTISRLTPFPSNANANKIYGPSNPRWNGQNYYWAYHKGLSKYVWTSHHSPRPEFADRQCDHCCLYGHIQWNCPKYECPHCHVNCLVCWQVSSPFRVYVATLCHNPSIQQSIWFAVV